MKKKLYVYRWKRKQTGGRTFLYHRKMWFFIEKLTTLKQENLDRMTSVRAWES